MLARYLLVALACWSSAALAVFTEEDAARIGREANVQGLRALVAQHNPALIYRAASSWNFGGSRDLSDPLEALVIEHYADRDMQRPLLSLLARQLDNFERYPKYRTRKLFDLLYADLKAGRDTLHYATLIIATDQPVDAELTALLAQLDPAAANELVMFLGHRKYAAALPALQALQARVPHDKNVNQMIERVDWAYVQIGTPQATQALYARLRALGAMKTDRAQSEVWNILLYVSQQPAGSPPDYGELRAALPAELNDSSWDQLIRLIEKRKEKRGVPELQRAITQSKRADQAVSALLVVGTPDDWRAARQSVQNPSVQQKLDAAIANPTKLAEQQRQQDRVEDLNRSRMDYDREKARLYQVRKTDPKRFVAEMVPLLARREAEIGKFSDMPLSGGARQDLGRDYMLLGTVQRFELRQPDEAIASFVNARRVFPTEAFDVVSFFVADTLRFDKRDNPKAIAAYREALASLDRPTRNTGGDARLLAAFKPWLESEIAYLERGKRFSGAIGREDMTAVYFWLGILGTQMAPMEERRDLRTLALLPASQFQLARAYPSLLELEPKEMLAFFAKHDPAGYLTASVLSFSMLKEPSPYVQAAADTFFRERGIRSMATSISKPDPRYATPEKTWAAFIAAGKKGDSAAMLDCMTPDIQRRFGPLFSKMSRDDLRKSAESFLGMSITSSYGEFREAMVVRQLGDKKMAGSVTFVNEGGSWKISEM
ncbi:MAG TPA: hypothetical protein VL199_12870 [Burkholderiales bacterium]|nr:hypothetical protein [Burkholderiales bacterium]